MYTCFIDYSKAFDSVKHEKLINCLKEIHLDGKDIQLITNLYWDQSASVRCNNETTQKIAIKKGVRQGCVLSPSLFNIYTENIFEHIRESPGLAIGGENINNLRYADDTALLAENMQDLQDLLNRINERSQECGLEINIRKTKIMIISRANITPKADIYVNGEKLEQVESYSYLGHLITEDGRCEKEIKRRIGIAKNSFNNMKQIFLSKQISVDLKKRMVKCYIYSTLLYGAETWTLNKDLMRQIEAFEMWIYRRLGHISWQQKKTNEEVLRIVNGKKELLHDLARRQMKYFGHIKRHNTILRTILEGKVEGTRPRGRPRYKWTDNIKKWSGLSMAECSITAQDRDAWSSIIANIHWGDGT